jgi:cytidyltransferase-like protein
MRYVDGLCGVGQPGNLDDVVEAAGAPVQTWVTDQGREDAAACAFCREHGLDYVVLDDDALAGFPEREADPRTPGRNAVVVTGCYDWLHSGHVRFFQVTSALGDLYVVVGHDANIALLKGEGHPMIKEDERRYMAQSVRFVSQAFVSSGQGWMDAAPEIERLKPDIYAVNEDGDVPEKRAFCREHGLKYVVLKRTPKEGLKRRSSTDLRGL